jgi:hypothetical protein
MGLQDLGDNIDDEEDDGHEAMGRLMGRRRRTKDSK